MAPLLPARAAEASFPGQNGSIAFERFGDVYLADSGGSGAEARPPRRPGEPCNIAGRNAGAYEYGHGIWVMNSAGGSKVNVTNDNGTGDNHPTFSPDGASIAFNSSRPSGNPTAVYLVGAGGGPVSRLAASSGFDNDPDWGALDVAAPGVTRVTPAAGDRDVSPKANVTAAFSEPMDAGTLNGSTFSLRKKGGARVAAKLTYDATTQRAVLNPSNGLKPGTAYVATVAVEAGDRAGNALSAQKARSFTVRR